MSTKKLPFSRFFFFEQGPAAKSVVAMSVTFFLGFSDIIRSVQKKNSAFFGQVALCPEWDLPGEVEISARSQKSRFCNVCLCTTPQIDPNFFWECLMTSRSPKKNVTSIWGVVDMPTLQKTGQKCLFPYKGKIHTKRLGHFWPVFCNVCICTTPQIVVRFFLGLSEVVKHSQKKFKVDPRWLYNVNIGKYRVFGL